MTIHYHGTPLTPRSMLYRMAGKHFCVPFADGRDADVCMQIGQSVMWDNGAYTMHTTGTSVEWSSYYRWLETRLGHPHWAVIPDVIDGDMAQNDALVEQWPFEKHLAAPVWHLGVPLSVLGRYLDSGYSRICFGSSGAYWQVGSEAWSRRTDEAFNWLAKNNEMPWVHMLRGMAVAGKRWPFASVDSANVARNFKDTNSCPEAMSRTIDAVQCPHKWTLQHEQMEMIDR